MKKTLMFWVAFVVAVLVALYLTVRVSMVLLGIGNIAQVGSISARIGSGPMTRDDIKDALAIIPGQSAIGIDLEKYLARMLALPDIQHAAVFIRPNGKIEVKATQKHAVAIWTDGEKFYPLTADGKIIERPLDSADPGRLVFSGVLPNNISAISDIIRAHPNIAAAAATLAWIDGRRWNITTSNNITIKLPENNAAAAISKLSELQKQSSILQREISVIDLRDGERTLVKLK
ncbi:MAG: cell division protein FtsQ/DivIB [Alphaproteobacteria bacterium]|nr:cell division protein FtsQ/DivIB [Alphaproteobacteria bacterium]